VAWTPSRQTQSGSKIAVRGVQLSLSHSAAKAAVLQGVELLGDRVSSTETKPDSTIRSRCLLEPPNGQWYTWIKLFFVAAWLKTFHVLKLKMVGGSRGATSYSTSRVWLKPGSHMFEEASSIPGQPSSSRVYLCLPAYTDSRSKILEESLPSNNCCQYCKLLQKGAVKRGCNPLGCLGD
jgi:hypothetical protein